MYLDHTFARKTFAQRNHFTLGGTEHQNPQRDIGQNDTFQRIAPKSLPAAKKCPIQTSKAFSRAIMWRWYAGTPFLTELARRHQIIKKTKKSRLCGTILGARSPIVPEDIRTLSARFARRGSALTLLSGNILVCKSINRLQQWQTLHAKSMILRPHLGGCDSDPPALTM